MEHIRVFFVDMPSGIKGFTVKNDDDSYTILINAGLSHEMQIEAYDHEISHIDNNDYGHFYDVNILEEMRHDSSCIY